MDGTSRSAESTPQAAVVVSSVEDSGLPFYEVPVLEVDESIPPRPEEEIADLLRAEPRA